MPMSQMVPVSSWAAGVGPAENSANGEDLPAIGIVLFFFLLQSV